MKRRTEGTIRVPTRQGLIEAAAIAAETCELSESQAAVLRFFAESEHLHDHCLCVSQEIMVKELGIPRSTVNRIIQDLDRLRLVYQVERGTRQRAQVYFTTLHTWAPHHLTTMKSINGRAAVGIGSGGGGGGDGAGRGRVGMLSSPDGDSTSSSYSSLWTTSRGSFQGGADGYRLLTNRKRNHCSWCRVSLERGQGYLAKPLGIWVVLCDDHAFDGHLVELSVFAINELPDFCQTCGEEIPALGGFMERANRVEAREIKGRWFVYCPSCSKLPAESRRLLTERRRLYLVPGEPPHRLTLVKEQS